MTFVSNDPAFRAAYGSTVFVGDRYTGNLAPSATLTLTRPDGSTADTVTYGGAGWPVPTSGQSLELTDLAADNDNGANWALSTGSGTPGTATGGTGHHRPRRTHHRHRHRRQRHGHRHLDRHRPDNGGSAITGYQVRVAQQRRHPGRGPAPRRRRRHQPDRHRAHQRHRVPASRSPPPTAPAPAPTPRSSNTVTPTSGATVPGPPVIGAPTQGAVGGALTADRPLDPTHQHRRLRHHRLPGHRTPDELRGRRRHGAVHAPTSRVLGPARHANATSPSPPATTASRSSPSTPSAPAHPQPAPPTSSPAEPRHSDTQTAVPARPAVCASLAYARERRLSFISRMRASEARPSVGNADALGPTAPDSATTNGVRRESRRSTLSAHSQPRPP